MTGPYPRPTPGEPTLSNQPTMRRALRHVWLSWASLVHEAGDRLHDRSLLIKIRGYLLVAIGVVGVSRFLKVIVGTVPNLPTEFANGLILVTVLLAILIYRQTWAALRRHELETRDRIQRTQPGPVERYAAPSEACRVMREMHWRFRRATAWGVTAFAVLLVYSFGLKSSVRLADIPDPVRQTVQTRVIVPLVLPESTRAYIESIGGTEPIDDILTDNAAYFAQMFPNEHPEYIMATVLPLQLLYVLMCVCVTRSLAFAAAPRPEEVRKTETAAKAGVEIEPKSAKDLPDGDDGIDAALDILDDIVGST